MSPLEKAELELHRMLARLKGGEDMTTMDIVMPLDKFIEEKIQAAFETFARRIDKWSRSQSVDSN